MLFVSADPGSPASAFLKMNDALGAEGSRIRARVAETYIVRTRADEPGKEARTGDTTPARCRVRDRRAVSSAPTIPNRARSERATSPGCQAPRSLPARCNPVTAPPGCRDAWLEASR